MSEINGNSQVESAINRGTHRMKLNTAGNKIYLTYKYFFKIERFIIQGVLGGEG